MCLVLGKNAEKLIFGTEPWVLLHETSEISTHEQGANASLWNAAGTRLSAEFQHMRYASHANKAAP